MTKLKTLITEAVLEQMPNGEYAQWTTEDALKRWWITGPTSEVLRLTEMGDMAFRLAEIEFYKYDFLPKVKDSYHAYMINLGKKMKCPYYLGVNKLESENKKPYIKLYDSKIAMMVNLYGDLDSYLKSIKVRT
jgi:hypothetical protein